MPKAHIKIITELNHLMSLILVLNVTMNLKIKLYLSLLSLQASSLMFALTTATPKKNH